MIGSLSEGRGGGAGLATERSEIVRQRGEDVDPRGVSETDCAVPARRPAGLSGERRAARGALGATKDEARGTPRGAAFAVIAGAGVRLTAPPDLDLAIALDRVVRIPRLVEDGPRAGRTRAMLPRDLRRPSGRKFGRVRPDEVGLLARAEDRERAILAERIDEVEEMIEVSRATRPPDCSTRQRARSPMAGVKRPD
jgi:hypothetical protein